jgi:hypothetical protein
LAPILLFSGLIDEGRISIMKGFLFYLVPVFLTAFVTGAAVAAITVEAGMEFLAIQFRLDKDGVWPGVMQARRPLTLQINHYKDQTERKSQWP